MRRARSSAVVAGPQDMGVGLTRLAGYRQALQRAGVGHSGEQVGQGDFSEASGAAAVRHLLERVPHLDAVFAASDLMACGALRALREAGRRVPEDVAVVGHDDLPLASYADPPLTTIRQPVELLGQEMVRLLLHRLSDPDGDPESIILPTELVVRASA